MSNPQLVGGGETSSKITPRWTFADRLRKIRREFVKVNQEKMAELLGIDKGSYANWEYGRSYPRNLVSIATRIEIISGVKAEWVLGMPEAEPDEPQNAPDPAEKAERDAIVQRILTATLRAQDGVDGDKRSETLLSQYRWWGTPAFVSPAGVYVTQRDKEQIRHLVGGVA